MEIKSLLNDKVLVEISQAETQTASGIFLASESIKKTLEGRVLLVGPKVKTVKVGDRIKYYDHCGVAVEHQGKECLFLKEATEIELVL